MIKEITIISGKGGAGKTSITASLSLLSDNAVICDNDVNAADLHILLQPKIKETHVYYGSNIASIDNNKCTLCGMCMQHCRFEAIHFTEIQGYYINELQCEGCMLCNRICNERAITYSASDTNYWYCSTTRAGEMIHARLSPGEDNSGKLVTEIRKQARITAQKNNASYILNDGPPGIGCSAISSITGTDLVVVVVEASLSGWHDAKRLIDLIDSFNIPTVAIINKYDLNDALTFEIEKKLAKLEIPLIAKLPFSNIFVDSMIERKAIVEFAPTSELSDLLKICWNRICMVLK